MMQKETCSVRQPRKSLQHSPKDIYSLRPMEWKFKEAKYHVAIS